MIIKEKIMNKYTKAELEKILGNKKDYFYKKDFNITIQYLANIFDIDSLNYSLDDFIQDYPRYTSYKEIKTVFNIFKAGRSINSLRNEYDIKIAHIKTQLRNGFIYNSTSIPKELFKFVAIDYDFSKFKKIEYYKKHIEIYDDKSTLEEFREKFNLREKVYFEKYKNSWHLAIQGFLAEYIRNLKKDTSN